MKYWVTAIVFLLSGCSLDRIVSFDGFVSQFVASPTIICSEDPVELNWNITQVAKSREFCSMPDGGVSPRQLCAATSDCSVGGMCLNGLCVADSVAGESDFREIDFGDGCFEDTIFTVADGDDPSGVSPRAPTVIFKDPRQSGRMSVVPEVSTTYNGEAGKRTFVGISGERIARTVTLIVRYSIFVLPGSESVELAPPIPFTYIRSCSNPSGPWTLSMSSLDLITGEDVEVLAVSHKHTESVTFTLTDPSKPTVTLAPGSSTMALNGKLSDLWTASVDDNALIPASCTTDSLTPLPPIEVEIQFKCVRDSE